MNLRIISNLICFISLSSCAGTINSVDIEQHYKNLIGNKYDPSVGWGDNWKKIYDRADSLEFEFTHSNGCSYAVKINKQINIVEGFRFTSDRAKCDKNYVFP